MIMKAKARTWRQAQGQDSVGGAETQGSSPRLQSDMDNHYYSTASTQACKRLLIPGTLSEKLPSF